MAKYFYARVSTKDQNLARQLESAKQYCDVDRVFDDKQSGKNFEREGYQEMKSILEPGDEVIVHAVDRLGRNKDEMKKELAWFKEKKVRLRILNVPTTLIEYPEGQEWVMDMVNNVLIEVLSAFAEQERENIRKRQAEGIAAMPVVNGRKVSAKTGRGFGHDPLEVEIDRREGESVSDCCKRLGISRSTYYRRVQGVVS